jgi:signal peptidase I
MTNLPPPQLVAEPLPEEPADELVEAAPANGGWRAFREWGLVIGIALAVALIIRTFAIAPFYIPSNSMFDTLAKRDRILVNKLSYRLHDVHRGDVVVFEKPPGVNFGDDNVEDLIKRVIGVPGDTLAFRDGSVFVNGAQLVEPYTDGVATDPPSEKVDPDQDGQIVVPANEYFVMGDNRRSGQSFDSRYWGFVDDDLIVGRAFVLIWPKGHWSWL